jgi:RimJ/RimL family protein N-acetyltransferase
VQATITAAGRAAEVAWVIAMAWQGQGLAAEAAEGLVAWLKAGGVQTITAHVHPDHHASAAVAARAGLAATGEMHDGERIWRRGQGRTRRASIAYRRAPDRPRTWSESSAAD